MIFSRRPQETILILLLALTIGYTFFDALVKPIVNFDDLWRQGGGNGSDLSPGDVLPQARAGHKAVTTGQGIELDSPLRLG